MSRLYFFFSMVIVALLSLSIPTSSEARVSIYFSFPQQQVYVPSEQYVDCYTEMPVIYHGRLHDGRRVCEYRSMPMQTVWYSRNTTYYYHERHHYRHW